MRQPIWRVSGYLREDLDNPVRETSEYLLGYVMSSIHLLPFHETADIHVEFMEYQEPETVTHSF